MTPSAAATKAVYILCFVNMVQVENYMKAHGQIKATSELANQQDFS